METFESQLKEWEIDMRNEIGSNKAAVTNFSTDVADCLENMSKTMNANYSLTIDYHSKVMESMDSLEKQVFKPADISKNFIPPTLAGGEKIMSLIKAEINEEPRAGGQDDLLTSQNSKVFEDEDRGATTPQHLPHSKHRRPHS